MTDYVILRNAKPTINGGRRPADPFGFPQGPMASTFGLSPMDMPELELEVTSLGTTDIHEAARDPGIAAYAPVMPTHLIEPTSANGSASQTVWGIDAVGAATSGFDGSGIVVSVLDTVIDETHPAFAGVTLVQEDFTNTGNGDQHGHGTHCAGTIFGRDIDGTRIGIARGVTKALIGKVLDQNGSGNSDMLFNGIKWAEENGAKVISMSLGFNFPGMVDRLIRQGWPADLAGSVALEAYRANLRVFDTLMAMVRARMAFTGGTVVVAAAGNESRRDQNPNFEIAASLPAAADGVVSVGALGKGSNGNGLELAWFSNTFPRIAAPGVDILSAKAGGDLVSFNGTSMACPHVAGLAALWWQAVRAMNLPTTADTVVAHLMASARADALAPNIDVADRGVGLAMAPQS